MAEMLSRRQFRHHATIFGVELNLGRNEMRQDATLVNNGRTGFVTRCFQRQKGHGSRTGCAPLLRGWNYLASRVLLLASL